MTDALSPAEQSQERSDAPSAVDTPPERPDGPTFTLTEAAAACRVHRATLRRALDDDRFPKAYRDGDGGPWKIPLADLQAAGFHLSALGAEEQRTDERDSDDQAELARLRAELQHTRELLQRADATIEVLSQAVRALSPAPVPEQSQPAPEPVASARRRWWQR